ncbi:potassium-transporting ATPase subunit C [Enterococcus caccae]|uniref:Potassium-transporting ATPase KdpC subunit n=1 Tax=Enterococcus caccae ATCC BAA-1240 TaxID=1158612 RepID=R3U8X0_9ENTE|nr:potassium-transporting ATPase subunit C [Enterococcus caccae]EOL49923.1 K+-transporting ATPase, C subunit [Enterococcus caccae ATCC BAA-1240]EOT56263.1 K+-transporting ATPase, C subunit [Enterococcus caccae ATCC BAA-1240]OJG26557.1 K+-transporting ATPase, C subunit [Enterococcus caccae]
MKKIMIASLKSILLFTVICGVIYTAAVTAVGQVLFPTQANGSLLKEEKANKTVITGSKLIGQTFSGEKYLHGRPVQVSQLSPVSKEQKSRVEKRVQEADMEEVPLDLVTASASGIDPEISIAAAMAQANRIATTRNMKNSEVRAIIKQNITGLKIGPVDSRRVNVLGVNQSLDESE